MKLRNIPWHSAIAWVIIGLHYGGNLDTNRLKFYLVFLRQLVRVECYQPQTGSPILEVVDQLMRNRSMVIISIVVMVKNLCYLCHYLLVRSEGPVTLNSGVTEVLHLLQHGCHEGGPQLFCISAHALPLPISDVLPLLVPEVLSYPFVIVKGR